jgi:DNA-binding transcriptional regulator YiaG
MKQCIICDREIPPRIGRRCARCRVYHHRHGVERPLVTPRPRDRATMSGAAFRQWRQSWGWSLQQIAEAQHYTYQAVIGWEAGRSAVPEPVAAWARAIGAPPNTHHYGGTVAGLIKYLQAHGMRCIELAVFLGIHESTVIYWLQGRTKIPPPIQVWLRAGAPSFWEHWGPPGTEQRYRAAGKSTYRATRNRPYMLSGRAQPPRLVPRLLRKIVG